MNDSLSVKDDFPFIQKILSTAFHADTIYVSYPYDNIPSIDRKLRDLMWKDIAFTPEFLSEASGSQYHMYIIRSALDFYNIIALVTLGEHPDFISVGPVRDKSECVPERLSSETLEESCFYNQKEVYDFYEQLPLVSISDLTITLQDLLEHYIPQYHEIIPEQICFSAKKNAPVFDSEKWQTFTFESAERFQTYLKYFGDILITGNTSLVYQQKQNLLAHFRPILGNHMDTVRDYLSFLNAVCYARILETHVHPHYTLDLFLSFAYKIAQLHDQEQGWLLSYEIARKYCLLVKNHNLSQYSYLVRNIINYVSAHLGEEMSLMTISGYLGKNPSYVSGQFKKEMKESLTEYIHRERIHAAIQIFNTTESSVAEAANAVGINELGYFTRLFKKHIGCTPSQYKKMLK